MVSECQVDHREVGSVEDRSTGLQRLVDLFLLDLFGGGRRVGTFVTSRRVGVSAVGEFVVVRIISRLDRKFWRRDGGSRIS